MIDLVRRRIEPRVGQLDASILDSELLNMLKNQLFEAFKIYRPEIKDKYENELVLLLKLALFKLTIWDNSATYGAKLQNLKFADGRSRTNASITLAQKVGYGLLVVGGGYFYDKLDEYLTHASYTSNNPAVERVRKLVDTLSTAWSASSLANFILFLFSGKYSTLVLRLLKIRLASTSRQVSKQVNFEFQNRQLVWNAFTEFLLFILPLLNLPKLKRAAVRLLSGSPKNNEMEAELAFLPDRVCAICYKQDATNDQITNPYQGECGHVYCYVCLKSKIGENEGEGWNCLRCGKAIKSADPFVDIDESVIIARDDEDEQSEKQPEPSTPKPEPKDASVDEEEDEEESDNENEEEEEEDEGSGFIVHDDY